jgi:hypothetical protein
LSRTGRRLSPLTQQSERISLSFAKKVNLIEPETRREIHSLCVSSSRTKVLECVSVSPTKEKGKQELKDYTFLIDYFCFPSA